MQVFSGAFLTFSPHVIFLGELANCIRDVLLSYRLHLCTSIFSSNISAVLQKAVE